MRAGLVGAQKARFVTAAGGLGGGKKSRRRTARKKRAGWEGCHGKGGDARPLAKSPQRKDIVLKSLIRLAALGSVLALPQVARADAPWFTVPRVSVWSGASTLGAGLTIGFHDPQSLVGVRGSMNFFRLGFNFEQSQAHSRAQATFQNESLLVDLYPFRGGFHVTGGVVFNQNSANYSSTPQLTGALLGFITHTHYTGVIGNVHGPISFNPIAPYLGIGYNVNAGKHWSVTVDAGAIYQGNGRIAVTTTGLLAMPEYKAQVMANAEKADRMINKMSYYPVVSFEIGYRF
jgi:hypothetical protein